MGPTGAAIDRPISADDSNSDKGSTLRTLARRPKVLRDISHAGWPIALDQSKPFRRSTQSMRVTLKSQPVAGVAGTK
jgi:hypothetical protein